MKTAHACDEPRSAMMMIPTLAAPWSTVAAATLAAALVAGPPPRELPSLSTALKSDAAIAAASVAVACAFSASVSALVLPATIHEYAALQEIIVQQAAVGRAGLDTGIAHNPLAMLDASNVAAAVLLPLAAAHTYRFYSRRSTASEISTVAADELEWMPLVDVHPTEKTWAEPELFLYAEGDDVCIEDFDAGGVLRWICT